MATSPHGATVIQLAPAKLNLFLEVLARRADGFHDINSFMVAVSLFDRLEFREEPDDKVRLTCTDPELPTGPENLVYRAAEAMRQLAGRRLGVHVTLAKTIPTAAGLAGGSSDAAATLVALNRLWRLHLSRKRLTEVAAELGSDVAFFLSLPAAWCSGRGERVRPATLPQSLWFVVATPPAKLSTAEVYRRVQVPDSPRSSAEFEQAVASGDVDAIGSRLFNRLQPTAEQMCHRVTALLRAFEELRPPGRLMSGSGPTCFALCRSEDQARSLAQAVDRRYRQLVPPEHGDEELSVFVVESLKEDPMASGP